MKMRMRINRPEIYRILKIPKNTQEVCETLIANEKMRYLFFGGLTTVLSIVVYWVAAKAIGIGYIPASVISWVLAVAFAFVTNKTFVFNSKSVESATLLREVALFVAARLLSLAFDLGWMVFAVEMIKMDDFIAKIISNVIVIVLNYIFSKLLIFRKIGGNKGNNEDGNNYGNKGGNMDGDKDDNKDGDSDGDKDDN